MTLRCPKCGSNRVAFLSMTDGTAVGSTDQRYLCKDCDYRGSLILDDETSDKDRVVLDDMEKAEREAPNAEPQEMLSQRTTNALFYVVMFAIIFPMALTSYSIMASEMNVMVALSAFMVTVVLIAMLYLTKRG